MKIKSFAMMAGVLALAACGDTNTGADLHGANFVSQSGDTQITLAFAPDAERVNGRVVNLYNASYTIDGNKIKFGEMLSTMMMGPESEMAVEQEYFQFMPTVETYELADGKLTLKNADGKTIVFTQVETLPAADAE